MGRQLGKWSRGITHNKQKVLILLIIYRGLIMCLTLQYINHNFIWKYYCNHLENNSNYIISVTHIFLNK